MQANPEIILEQKEVDILRLELEALIALATEAYEDQLSRSQFRTNSLLGLARAQARLGDESAARKSYATLAKIWKEADAVHSALVEVSRARRPR